MNNLNTTTEKGVQTNRSAHRLKTSLCEVVTSDEWEGALRRVTTMPSPTKSKVMPMNTPARGAGELARALKTSCFCKLFLLFSFSSESRTGGEKHRCALLLDSNYHLALLPLYSFIAVVRVWYGRVSPQPESDFTARREGRANRPLSPLSGDHAHNGKDAREGRFSRSRWPLNRR